MMSLYVGLFAAAVGVPLLILSMAWLAWWAEEHASCPCEHCREKRDA